MNVSYVKNTVHRAGQAMFRAVQRRLCALPVCRKWFQTMSNTFMAMLSHLLVAGTFHSRITRSGACEVHCKRVWLSLLAFPARLPILHG